MGKETKCQAIHTVRKFQLFEIVITDVRIKRHKTKQKEEWMDDRKRQQWATRIFDNEWRAIGARPRKSRVEANIAYSDGEGVVVRSISDRVHC